MGVAGSAGWEAYLAGLPPELRALHGAPSPDVLDLGDGRVLTAADLTGLLRRQAALPGPSGSVFLDAGDGAGLLAVAWREAVFRHAKAVLVLLDARLAVEAQANARACLEHAVVLLRLALAADEGTTRPLLLRLAADQERRQAKRLDYLDGLDGAAGGGHAALLAAARADHERTAVTGAGGPAVGGVRSHFDAVPDGTHLHSAYGTLSENLHAGLASAMPYLAHALGVPSGRPNGPTVAWAENLALLCWACRTADEAMPRFLADTDGLAARHGPLFAEAGL